MPYLFLLTQKTRSPKFSGIWRGTQVAKGADCKSAIHRFESGPRLSEKPYVFRFFIVSRAQPLSPMTPNVTERCRIAPGKSCWIISKRG